MDHLRSLVFAVMEGAQNAGISWQGITDADVAAEIVEYKPWLKHYDINTITPFVKEYCWQWEVNRISVLIQDGNFEQAESNINTWIDDIKQHIYKYLPEDSMSKLKAHRQQL